MTIISFPLYLCIWQSSQPGNGYLLEPSLDIGISQACVRTLS